MMTNKEISEIRSAAKDLTDEALELGIWTYYLGSLIERADTLAIVGGGIHEAWTALRFARNVMDSCQAGES